MRNRRSRRNHAAQSSAEEFLGLCTGYASPDPKRPPALVPWLNDKINEIAGKSSAEPLTFGHLERSGITLRMMTTCLTWGRPFTLPFTTGSFYFSPAEFRAFFPEEIVRWLETHPAQAQRGRQDRGSRTRRACRYNWPESDAGLGRPSDHRCGPFQPQLSFSFLYRSAVRRRLDSSTMRRG